MTDVFKKYDEDRDGYITMSFEEFLTGLWTRRDIVLLEETALMEDTEVLRQR